jgi:hypothetical protein
MNVSEMKIARVRQGLTQVDLWMMTEIPQGF